MTLARDLIGYGRNPPHAAWPGGARIAVNFVLNYEKAPSIRSPMGTASPRRYCRTGPSVNTRRLVVEHGGFLYDSDAYNDELPYWVRVGEKAHLVIPYTNDVNDTKFLNPAGYGGGEDFFAYLRDTFDLLHAEGETKPRMMSVGLHARIVGRPGRAAVLARFLDYVLRRDGVWICRREEIAKHWIEHHPARA